jgi:hypothetical protein
MDFGFITLIISVIKRHRVVRINRPLGIKLKTSRRKRRKWSFSFVHWKRRRKPLRKEPGCWKKSWLLKNLNRSLTKTESVEKLESRINELEQGLTCQRKLWLFQNRSGLVLSKAKTATILGSS